MTDTNHWATFDSPLGMLTLGAGERGINSLSFPDSLRAGGAPRPAEGERPRELDRDERPAILAEAIEQLGEYFAGAREAFELPLDLSAGTDFQRAVWAQLVAIPCGASISYTELAHRVGRPNGARAVGAAVGRTTVPIVIPCHRAVGMHGNLTGYRGGLERKRALLDFERRIIGGGSVAVHDGQLTLLRSATSASVTARRSPCWHTPLRARGSSRSTSSPIPLASAASNCRCSTDQPAGSSATTCMHMLMCACGVHSANPDPA